MRLVELDQSKLLDQEKFFTNGFQLHKLQSSDKFVNILHDLWDGREAGKLKDGFSWEQKMPNVFHLRPNVYQYDDVFFDFLLQNDISNRLQTLTGRKLHLCHVQVVAQTPGPPHQDWHRDAYQYGSDPIVGAFPAAIKVNFYPQFDKPEPRLKYVRGSHRCMLNDAKFDAMLIGKYENEILHSNNDQALIFESSILHAVAPDMNPKGSIRVMYSFAMEHEYNKRFAAKEHHKKLHDLYENMLSQQDNKLEIVENYIKDKIQTGYEGNPYAPNLAYDLRHDGRVEAYEDILDMIAILKR